MIKQCTCSHEGQDEIHGKGQRVFNLTQKGGLIKIYRCTVCASEKS